MKDWIKTLLVWLGTHLYGLRGRIADASLPRFANAPARVRIDLPRNLAGTDRIWLGDDVELGPGCFLIAVREYPSRKMRSDAHPMEPQSFEPSIRIGHRVTATAGLQIFSQASVEIGDDVMFATNVYVNDGSHGYRTADVPYKYQPIERIAPVRIGAGCWLGQNVVIMPGVEIGERTLVGANSVVTDSLPARCIAVGAPARVVKRWSDLEGGWVAEGASHPA